MKRIGDSLRSYKIDSKQIYESFCGTDESPNGSAIFWAYPEWPDKAQLDEFKRNTSFREIHNYPAMIEIPLVEYIKNVSRRNIAVGGDVLSIILPRIPSADNEVLVRLNGTTPGVPTGATPWLLCYPDGAYCPRAYDALPGGGISFTFKRRDKHLIADTAQGEPTGN